MNQTTLYNFNTKPRVIEKTRHNRYPLYVFTDNLKRRNSEFKIPKLKNEKEIKTLHKFIKSGKSKKSLS